MDVSMNANARIPTRTNPPSNTHQHISTPSLTSTLSYSNKYTHQSPITNTHQHTNQHTPIYTKNQHSTTRTNTSTHQHTLIQQQQQKQNRLEFGV